jgi:RAB6A-GEF complex partner protein 1
MQVARNDMQPYCLVPVPQSQLVLPYLLRRLLQQNDHTGAQLLARHHQHGPHFSRSLEWLLFTALDTDFCGSGSARTSTNGGDCGEVPWAEDVMPPRPSPLGMSLVSGGVQAAISGEAGCSPPGGRLADQSAGGLLRTAFDLVRRFVQWRDVVVNVSRKTDATMWPLLFSVVGQPSSLLRELLTAGQVRHSPL